MNKCYIELQKLGYRLEADNDMNILFCKKNPVYGEEVIYIKPCSLEYMKYQFIRYGKENEFYPLSITFAEHEALSKIISHLYKKLGG